MTRLRNVWLALFMAGVALVAANRPAAAGMKLEEWKGHVSAGYTKLYSDSLAPGGSISVSGGVDYPLGKRYRLGPTIAFHLLGSSQVKRGSVNAGLDYSMFDAAMQLTYLPQHGPVSRLSVGPGLALPKADLSVAGGGAGFGDLTVSEAKPEFAADVTLSPRSMTVVAIGLELGVRIVPVSQGTWTTFSTRFAILF